MILGLWLGKIDFLDLY